MRTAAQSGQDLRCSPTQFRNLVEDIGLIAKILTRSIAVQTGLGLSNSYMPYGRFLATNCSPESHFV